MYLLPLPHLIHRYLSASAHHSVRCFTASLLLSIKLHFSFGLGLSSSHSFHSSTKQWKLAAHCKATYTSSLLLHHCSWFFQLISLLITFGDAPLKLRHLFLFFLRAVCLQFFHLLQDASFYRFFTIFCPQVCISGSGLDTFLLTIS